MIFLSAERVDPFTAPPFDLRFLRKIHASRRARKAAGPTINSHRLRARDFTFRRTILEISVPFTIRSGSADLAGHCS
jgi:hypothetical protein